MKEFIENYGTVVYAMRWHLLIIFVVVALICWVVERQERR